MKKRTTIIASIGLLGAYGTAMAGADKCLDCHEASEFADTPTAGLVEAVRGDIAGDLVRVTPDKAMHGVAGIDETNKVVRILIGRKALAPEFIVGPARRYLVGRRRRRRRTK